MTTTIEIWTNRHSERDRYVVATSEGGMPILAVWAPPLADFPTLGALTERLQRSSTKNHPKRCECGLCFGARQIIRHRHDFDRAVLGAQEALL